MSFDSHVITTLIILLLECPRLTDREEVLVIFQSNVFQVKVSNFWTAEDL